MELGDHCGFDDLYVNDERIPVSREVFQAVCKENNHIRYLARCEKRCMQARYFMCPGDCLLCPWHRRGIFENPDGIDNTPFLLDQRDVEEEMILRETASAVYSFADRLVKDGSAILKMRFVCGCSCREIAREMGVSHSCICKRLHRMLTHFRAHAQLLSDRSPMDFHWPFKLNPPPERFPLKRAIAALSTATLKWRIKHMSAMMRNMRRMKQQMTGMKCSAEMDRLMMKVSAQKYAAVMSFKTRQSARKRTVC